MPQTLPLGYEEINHHMVNQARKVTLKDRKTTRRVSITPCPSYPCLTIWSEPGNPFVCLEPNSARRGAFETRELLNQLPPQQSWSGSVIFTVENLGY